MSNSLCHRCGQPIFHVAPDHCPLCHYVFEAPAIPARPAVYPPDPRLGSEPKPAPSGLDAAAPATSVFKGRSFATRTVVLESCCCLLITCVWVPEPLLRSAAIMLIGLNWLNLLPIGSLDGAQFLNAVLFSRHPVLETIFGVLTSIAMIALAVYFEAVAFGVWGALGLIILPTRHRMAATARRFKRGWSQLPFDVRDAGDSAQRDLYRSARDSGLMRLPTPAGNANVLAQIYQRANSQTVSAWGTVVLMAVYASGFVVPIVAGVLHRVLVAK